MRQTVGGHPPFTYVIAKPGKFVHSDVETRYRCPCRGYRKLALPEALELCPVCWWEDDGQEDHDASEVRLIVNGNLSLEEARLHFAQCGAAHPRFRIYVRSPAEAERSRTFDTQTTTFEQPARFDPSCDSLLP